MNTFTLIWVIVVSMIVGALMITHKNLKTETDISVAPSAVVHVEVEELPEIGNYSYVGALLTNDEEVKCLIKNIYFEARNQSHAGRVAVAFVTFNRVNSNRFPDTICGVVKQANKKNGKIVKHRCSFSWYCDGKPDDMDKGTKTYREIVYLVHKLRYNINNLIDITEGSKWYHATYVKPDWVSEKNRSVHIDDHIFYR
jgi:N-acetylmuramoyl-L-alanine amidase